MKERIKGAFKKKKIFHFLKMVLFVVALSLILLSLLCRRVKWMRVGAGRD